MAWRACLIDCLISVTVKFHAWRQAREKKQGGQRHGRGKVISSSDGDGGDCGPVEKKAAQAGKRPGAAGKGKMRGSFCTLQSNSAQLKLSQIKSDQIG